MSLSSLNKNYLTGKFYSDLIFILKVAENNDLRLAPTKASNLALQANDGVNKPVIGYGYDINANWANIKSDFSELGITLSSTQLTELAGTAPGDSGSLGALATLSLPSEQIATQLLELELNRRGAQFNTFLVAAGIDLPDSRERAALLSMFFQTGAYFFG